MLSYRFITVMGESMSRHCRNLRFLVRQRSGTFVRGEEEEEEGEGRVYE